MALVALAKFTDPSFSFSIIITSKWGLLTFIFEPVNEFSTAIANFIPSKQQV